MGRRMREEDNNSTSVSEVASKTITAFTLLELEIKNLNASYYSSLNRIKELVEENQELKLQIEELKNNANI
jgi:cell shape-determining protein MreC